MSDTEQRRFKTYRVRDLTAEVRAAAQKAVDQHGLWWDGQLVFRALEDDDVVMFDGTMPLPDYPLYRDAVVTERPARISDEDDAAVAAAIATLHTAEAQLTAIIDSDMDKIGRPHWAAASDARRDVRGAIYVLSFAEVAP